jgi:predicted RNA polymerase sigma factor
MVARSFIDALVESGELANYYLAHSARADMYRSSAGSLRLGPLMRKLWR